MGSLIIFFGFADAYGQQQWIPAQMAPPQQPTQQPPPMLVPPPAMVNLNHPHHRGMMVAAGGRKKLEPATAPTQDGKIQGRDTILHFLLHAPRTNLSFAFSFVAVAQEAENQRTEFKKQRKGYVKKTLLLRRELQTLKDQRKDMNVGNVPLSPTTKGFMDENEKLQVTKLRFIGIIECIIDDGFERLSSPAMKSIRRRRSLRGGDNLQFSFFSVR